MDRFERIESAQRMLRDCINRIIMEHDMTAAEMIGILEIEKNDLFLNPIEDD